MRAALIFDTETSDLWKPELPWNDRSQPHLLSLSAGLFDGDGRRVSFFGALCRPDGWTIAPEAEAKHRISNRAAGEFGIATVAALAMFQQFCSVAFTIVAHHMNFDRAIMDAALARAGSSAQWWQRRTRDQFCTMENSADVVNLPGGFGKPKFPSLEEAHNFFFPERGYRSKHDAESDMMACADIFFALKKVSR